MNATEFKKLLLKLPDGEKACSDAREWAEGKTLKQAYDECKYADWMLWLFCKMSDQPGWPTLRQVTGTSARCAETVLQIFEEKHPKDKRPRECIEACYKYERGEIDLEELEKYRRAAVAAAFYAAAYDHAVAAYAADAHAADAHAADVALYAAAAADAADAYAAAVYAADVALYAAAAADAAVNAAVDVGTYDGVKKTHHVIMCEIIRRRLKLPKEED